MTKHTTGTSGACINGSTDPPKDATKPAPGFAATTSTTRAENSSRMETCYWWRRHNEYTASEAEK
jgi:hypothetical protein